MGGHSPALCLHDRIGARHLYLQSPYFILDASIAEALKSAALSGVDVKVMLTARPRAIPSPATRVILSS